MSEIRTYYTFFDFMYIVFSRLNYKFNVVVSAYIQGDQLYMAVYSWYLVKRDLSSVRYCTVAYTSVTFYNVKKQKQQCPVYLVELYIIILYMKAKNMKIIDTV